MSFRSFGGPSSIHLFVSLFATPVTPVLGCEDCQKRMVSLTFYLPTVIFISLVGGFLPLLRELSQKALALLLSFSAGVLLGAVFFHMLPETGRVLSDNMGWPILTGFLLIFVMVWFVFVISFVVSACVIC